MFTVRYWWVDGSYDEFTVPTKKHAEAMRSRLYRNEDIVSVEVEEEV